MLKGHTTRYFKYMNKYINKYNISSFEITEEKKYCGHITISLLDGKSHLFKYSSIVDLYKAASQLSGDYIDPIDKKIASQAMPF